LLNALDHRRADAKLAGDLENGVASGAKLSDTLFNLRARRTPAKANALLTGGPLMN
jgi:hypothetical protein